MTSSLTLQSPPEGRRMKSEQDRLVPKLLLRAVAAVMLLSLALASYARLTDRPLEATPKDGPIAQERLLWIYPRMDGSARVLDADGAVVADLAPEQGGFVSGVSRALARVRDTHGVAEDAPVRLIRFTDGRMALRDPETGWRIELIGFGADNTAAFARLMEGAPGSPPR